MSTPNKAILRYIKMTYTGDELAYQLAAWEAIPTLKSDCFSKALEKEYARAKFVRELKAKNVNSEDAKQ